MNHSILVNTWILLTLLLRKLLNTRIRFLLEINLGQVISVDIVLKIGYEVCRRGVQSMPEWVEAARILTSAPTTTLHVLILAHKLTLLTTQLRLPHHLSNLQLIIVDVVHLSLPWHLLHSLNNHVFILVLWRRPIIKLD